jgi:aspartate/methionine/tyrosine aminotransferase
MRLPDFAIERYFAVHEFTAPYLLCASDVEGVGMEELLALADDDGRALWRDLRLGYTETAGHPILRREIAGLHRTIAPEDVYVFAGAGEAIFILVNALLGPGDHAVSTWPAYQSLFEVARATGADVDLLPLDPGEGWRLDLDRLRRLLRANTRLVIVNFPHNPTGALPDQGSFRALVELCEEAGCILLSDEVYRNLEYDPSDRLPAAADLSARAVSINVLSKSYGLAGLRIGWLACRDPEVLRAVTRIRDYVTLCNSAPSEILAIIALRAREALWQRSRRIVGDNLALVDRFFAEHAASVDWIRPRAGAIGLPRLLTGEPIDAFAERLVRATGVLLLPDRVYGMSQNRFRLGFGRTNLPEGLARLAGALRG